MLLFCYIMLLMLLFNIFSLRNVPIVLQVGWNP